MNRLIALGCLLAATTLTYADNFIYGNNATFGSPYVLKIDKTTGAVLDTYTNLSGSNGRGTVVVGNTLYYTAVSSGSIYAYDLPTHTNLGAVFNVAGTNSLSTIAYDGTDFYIGDYAGSNHVYKYSTTGTLLKTLSLANCTGNCDGLEYFQSGGVGYLIENRGDAEGPYDVYNLDGSLKTANFIDTSKSTSLSTGIAFDGTNFFTSDIYTGQLSQWSDTGVFLKTFSVTGAKAGFSPLIEDLSADYSQVINPGVMPEPSTWIMLGTGALGMAGAVRRRIFNS